VKSVAKFFCFYLLNPPPAEPITTKKPYSYCAKKRVVSRRKNSVLSKNAKNCKKKRTFAHYKKPPQNHAKLCKNQHFQPNTSDFPVIPTHQHQQARLKQLTANGQQQTAKN